MDDHIKLTYLIGSRVKSNNTSEGMQTLPIFTAVQHAIIFTAITSVQKIKLYFTNTKVLNIKTLYIIYKLIRNHLILESQRF